MSIVFQMLVLSLSLHCLAQSQDGEDFIDTEESMLATNVFEKVSKMNDLCNPKTSCSAGGMEASAPPADHCDDKNRYFEKEIAKVVSTDSFRELRDSVPLEWTNSLQLTTCLRESQEAHGGPFTTCDANGKGLALRGRQAPVKTKHSGRGKHHASDSKYPYVSAEKACSSPNELSLMQASYSAVVDCLSQYMTGSDEPMPKHVLSEDIFSLISWESGFNMNAVSSTGAGGIGEFTQGAVQQLNKGVWQGMIKQISDSPKRSCQAIIKMNPKPYNGSRANRCEMISPSKGNPLENLLYTFAYQKDTRIQVQSAIDSLSSQNPGKIAYDKTSDYFKQRLIAEISIWGHNAGPAGIRVPLKSLMSSPEGQKCLRTKVGDGMGDLDCLENRLEAYVVQYQKNIAAKAARISEVKNYIRKMKDRMDTINQHSGSNIKCGF